MIMNKNAMLISDDPSFLFMMTTILDQFELQLLNIENEEKLWEEINEKKPSIVIWDLENRQDIQKIKREFSHYVPENCHILFFVDNISELSHLNNGKIHLIEKPFSPNEISQFLKQTIV